MLKNEDIKVLIKALESHESLKVQAFQQNIMMRKLGIQMGAIDEGEQDAIQRDLEEAADQVEKLHYSIILLQAKLIGMLDDAIVNDAVEFLKKGGDDEDKAGSLSIG